MVLTVSAANGTSFPVPATVPSHGVVRLSVKDLLAAHGIADEYGGVQIHADSDAGYIDTVHFTVDENTGFSALQKMFLVTGTATLEERGSNKATGWTTRAPMLALTTPDAEMKLPKGTSLHPRLYLRNVTGHSVDAKLQFNWRNDTRHGIANGPTLTLKPKSTQLVDVSALQAGGLIPMDATWASVYVTGGAKPDELMAIAASFSDQGYYGAQTPFNDQLAFQWAGGMWLFDPLHNSLTTVGNGGDAPVKAQFLLYYTASGANSSQKPYEMQQDLQPGEHMWVNIGDLIRRQVPDMRGQVLPVKLTSGTYEFKDLTARGHGSLFEGKVIIDKTNGHASYGCAICCGYNSGSMGLLGLNLGASGGETITSQNSCDSTPQDITNLFTYWTSSDTTVATVNNGGLVQGVAVGSVGVTANAYNVEEDLGGADMMFCPTGYVTASGTAYVASLSCTSVTRGGTTTCTGSGDSGTTFNSWSFSDGTNTVNRASGTVSSTWSGTAVVSGTVTATANFSNGSTSSVSAPLTVNARSGWAYTTQASTQVASIDPTKCSNVPYIPTTPDPSDYDGAACPYVGIAGDGSFSASQIAIGPNTGFIFLQDEPADGGSFTWMISADIDNASSTFYQAQCGNYNPQTMQGFISGIVFDLDTRRHEGGTMTSHYANYVAALSIPSTNLGTQLESTIAPPGGNISSAVTSTISSVSSGVSAYGGEPCGTHNTNLSVTCAVDGFVNFYPYAACQ